MRQRNALRRALRKKISRHIGGRNRRESQGGRLPRETVVFRTFAEADFPKPEEFLGREKLRRLFHLNSEEIFAVNAGNEHLVIVNAGFPPDKYAAISENCGIFPCGINVETVLPDENGAKVRVYERGSGYTLACGSGAIASAYVLQKLSGKSDFAINMPGGILSVSLQNDVATLKSEINEIYTGEINYEVK